VPLTGRTKLNGETMDNEYLKQIYGLLESGATLGTGAVSGLVGLPYGLYKGVTSGAYGTPEAPRIAAREAQQFMERNTYQPRTAEGQANLQQLAGLLEASKLPPVMPEASLLAAIPKQAYAAQAERAGMAAEKAIAPVVTRTMERGGLPAQLLGDLSQGSIRPMDVWHGSPHGPFPKFDSSKIGTGEGAQAYGHGIYTGEARGTGEEYRKALTGNQFGDKLVPTVDGIPSDTPTLRNLVRNGQSPEDFIASMQNKLKSQKAALSKASKDEILPGVSDYDMAEMALGETKKLIDEAKGYVGKEIKAEPIGYLYKVDLPDESIANMLDWDKPLSKQHKNVQEALKGIETNFPEIADFNLRKWMDADPLASTWHNTIVRDLGVDPQDISKLLKERNVPGIRYLDGGSRNLESGTSNFVVFPGNEDLLKIKEINDKPYEQWFPKTNLLD
jgi:hypothetical protein